MAGTSVDLTVSSNWNVMFLGDIAGAALGYIQSGQQARAMGDFNGDGYTDLVLAGSSVSFASRSGSGAVVVIYGNMFNSLIGTGNTFALASNTNYKFRYYAAADAFLSSGAVTVEDIDGDGLDDLMMAASFADTNGSNSGAVYIVKGSLMATYSGNGNDIDLTVGTNYNIRFDGPVGGSYIGNTQLATGDFDGDSVTDLVIAGHHANLNGSDSGSVYLIFDDVLAAHTGTNQTMVLSDASHYTKRIDGNAGTTLGGGSFAIGNFDGDNKDDLLVGTDYVSYNGRSIAGSVWVIYDDLLSTFGAQTILMASDSNWNVRFDGATAGDRITYGSLHTGDLDNNEKDDILVGSWNAGYNSRSSAGFLYWIPDSIFGSLGGTGKILDLATATSYKARFDGSVVNGRLTFSGIGVANHFNIGGLDLVLAEVVSDAAYVISNTALNAISGLGNNIDLLSSANYTVKYVSSGNRIILNGGYMRDMDGDGSEDTVLTAYRLDNGALVDTGGGYLIYNFPHTISPTSIPSPNNDSTPTFTGTVVAGNKSSRNIGGVEYKVDSNSTGSGWSACTATDGAFDSTSEAYTCTVASESVDGVHTYYFRAYDSLGVRTVQANYSSQTVTIETVAPTSFGLIEPINFITNTRPIEAFRKSSDASSGLSSYTLELDPGKNRSFTLSGIPTSGNGSSYYVWRDNAEVKVEFFEENDADANNDQIKVYFKGLNDGELTEGKHSWRVTAFDVAGNTLEKATDFYLDRTAPFISDLAIADVARVNSGETYQISETQRMIRFSGLATDLYQGSTLMAANGKEDVFEKVASGPDKIVISIAKQKSQILSGFLPEYEQYRSFEYELGEVKDVPNVEKVSQFFIALPYPLEDGIYQVRFSLTDLVGNNYDHKPFYLNVGKRKLTLQTRLLIDSSLARFASEEDSVFELPEWQISEASMGAEPDVVEADKRGEEDEQKETVRENSMWLWVTIGIGLLILILVIVWVRKSRKQTR